MKPSKSPAEGEKYKRLIWKKNGGKTVKSKNTIHVSFCYSAFCFGYFKCLCFTWSVRHWPVLRRKLDQTLVWISALHVVCCHFIVLTSTRPCHLLEFYPNRAFLTSFKKHCTGERFAIGCYKPWDLFLYPFKPAPLPLSCLYWHIQLNLSNTDTEGTEPSVQRGVRIKEVTMISSLIWLHL